MAPKRSSAACCVALVASAITVAIILSMGGSGRSGAVAGASRVLEPASRPSGDSATIAALRADLAAVQSSLKAMQSEAATAAALPLGAGAGAAAPAAGVPPLSPAPAAARTSLPDAPVDVAALDAAVAAAIAGIDTMYGEQSALLFNEKTLWRFVKPSTRAWLVTQLTRHLIRNWYLRARDPYVISISGMSVVAGHGNYFRDAYASVFNRTIRPLFEMARVPLEVNNRALGGMPEMPYSWCAKEFLGDDADVVTWEFGMMEGSKWEEVEDFIRHTLSLPHQPAILLMPNSATSQRFDVMQHYADKGGFVQQWAMDWPAMLAKLIGSGVPIHDEINAPDLVYRLDEDWRRRLALSAEERARAPLPAELERHARRRLDPGSWKCPDSMAGRQACIDALMDKRFHCKKCPGRVWWHPGWRGHQLRGVMLGRFWLTLFQDAIAQVRAKRAAGETALPPQPLQTSLPPPTARGAELAAIDTGDFETNRGLIAGVWTTSSEAGSWERFECATTYEPKAPAGRDLSDVVLSSAEAAALQYSSEGTWKRVISGADAPKIAEMTAAGAGYLDRKYVYSGGNADGWLSLRFTSGASSAGGLLIICEPTTSWHRSPNMLALTALEYSLDGVAVVVIRKVCEYDGGSGQCFLLSDPSATKAGGAPAATPGKTHVLSVRVPPTALPTAKGASCCLDSVCACLFLSLPPLTPPPPPRAASSPPPPPPG